MKKQTGSRLQALANARSLKPRGDREDGIALVIVLMLTLLLTALTSALVLTTSVEAAISRRYRNSQEALYAAQAAAERVVLDVMGAEDIDDLLTGTVLSTFVDGPPNGTRILADGTVLDLSQVVNAANCAKPTSCSASDMNTVTDLRPWGADNPRWRLYGFGPLKDLLPFSDRIPSSVYVVVMVGDDPFENDGDPTRDGADSSNPGSGVVALRAESFGVGSAHRIVEVTLAPLPVPKVRSWREVR